MLQQERKKISFDINELSYVIYGSPQKFSKFLQMQKIVSNDPILKFNPEHLQLSRKEMIQISCKQLVRYHQLLQFTPTMKGRQSLFFPHPLPLGVHFSMFYITLNNLCTDKQIKMFLQPVLRGQIYGCYAQTQLGHGSDVQNIQTTATYDKNTETFVLNSPTIGSIKWWIGELGIFATHAAIMAQLIINNKKYGPQVFIVPLRDLKTHKPLQGIEVGDIGPKYGFNAKDNGFLKLNNVRIPRLNMLMKYTKVSKEGQFQRKGNQRTIFATMLAIRSRIPYHASYALSTAITITTRYSIVRSQFKDQSGNQIQILDYQLQQNKILPYIAQTYALVFGSRQIQTIVSNMIKQVQNNDFSKLNQAHALSSGLKSIFTSDTLKALQVLRKSAGGHGFLDYSNLPVLLKQFAPAATYQGQNTILLLQTARFLLKGLQNIKKGKQVADFISYFEQMMKLPKLLIKLQNVKELYCPQTIRKIIMHHSYYKLVKASQKLLAGLSQGLSPKYAWDTYAGIALAEAGAAFTYYWIYQNFMQNVFVIRNENIKTVLYRLLCLYGINKILENSKGYFEGQIVSSLGFKLLFSAKQKLLIDLRNEALGLVQAFEYDDNTLKSAIGRKDGKPYETLLQWAKNYNRVNKPEVLKEIYDIYNSEVKGKVNMKQTKL